MPRSVFAAKRGGSFTRAFLLFFLIAACAWRVRGEATLELFQLRWADLTAKMPELAEAGYDSLWLPPPTKGSSVFSVGYDLFDPFDLGDKNQNGTVGTMYGTKAELLQMVQTAHRFGIRVYFDNVMNHRAFTVPGFNGSTPTNFYPGLEPRDFHLQTVGSYYANWPSIQDYNNQWDVQYESLSGLVDLATEPGAVNGNFGASLGSTTAKPVFVRQPAHPEYYMDTNQPAIEGSPWRPFNGTNGAPVAEDVNSYLIRSVMWDLNETKCDGFRLDAVKHVPSGFFGDTTSSFNGYCGAVQAMFDYVHGYGANVITNGYIEGDDNRNSCFDTEAPRNDAMLFGEHIGPPPSYGEYINRGMRLLNEPLRNAMNSAFSGGSLAGAEQVAYAPNGGFDPRQSVMYGQSQDALSCCATHRELHNAYYFMREGLPEIYSDAYNESTAPNYFPNRPHANYLGEFGDNLMPDICYVHNQLARGGTRPRWSEQYLIAFERYDYRDVNASDAYNSADATAVLFALNDNFGNPGDIEFDDGIVRPTDGYYGCYNGSPSKGQGLVVGFPPGSVLSQLSSTGQTNGGNRACQKLLVHAATQNYALAQQSVTNSDPAQRLIYVGTQTLANGGGAVEMVVPSGSWVMYGYQWPEASRASLKDAITFRQAGADAQRLTVYRHDGANGDTNYNPVFPFKMRGSIDANGSVIGGVNVSNRTYAIDVPILTNAPFDILVRNDASSVNTLVKLDGGVDINSQMLLGPTNFNGTAPTNFLDLRDNKPGYVSDIYLGYEQAAFQFRNGPEKFAAKLTNLRNNVTSLGAETYRYIVGGTNFIVNGSGNGTNINTSTATFVYHDPADTNTAIAPNNSATQRVPLSPTNAQPADIYIKVGYQSQINTCYLYYTTDGSNPEGSFGTGKGTTQVVQGHFLNHDSAVATIDWWKATIPAQTNGADVRYKVGLFNGGSYGFASGNPTNWPSIPPVSDADAGKIFGLTQAAITNFNPTSATVWLHNDLNPANTVTGLQEGFHIVRARAFLPRTNKSAVFNTFLQTFYYDAGTPQAVFAAPATNIATLSNTYYTVIVRADSTAIGLDYNIIDSSTNNDDAVTGQNNGNGLTNGVAKFATVAPATPTASLNALYPNYPVEFRFNYLGIPTNGTATITVRIRKQTSALFPGRYTTLTRTLNVVAPTQYVVINNPPADGATLTMSTNDVLTIDACFSQSLGGPGSIDNFAILVNGTLLPRRDGFGTPLYNISALTNCGPGLRTITCDWSGALPGATVIQVLATNGVTASDTRTVTVVPPPSYTPPVITGLANNNQLVVWTTQSNANYQVFATTNLLVPFAPISPVIAGSGSSVFYFDPSPDPVNKYYRIELLP